jgi:hypothetical protein
VIDGGLRIMFRTHLKAGWHWQSIETGGTGLGVPDSNFCTEVQGGGVEGWIEFKRTDAWAVQFRTEQVGWARERRMRKGRVFAAVRRHHDGGPRLGKPVDELWLFGGDEIPRLARDGLRVAQPLGVWHGGSGRWNWKEVATLLIS